MKSAYELAMERLEKEKGPAKKLNDDQRAEIAEIENKYEADAAGNTARLRCQTRRRGGL